MGSRGSCPRKGTNTAIGSSCAPDKNQCRMRIKVNKTFLSAPIHMKCLLMLCSCKKMKCSSLLLPPKFVVKLLIPTCPNTLQMNMFMPPVNPTNVHYICSCFRLGQHICEMKLPIPTFLPSETSTPNCCFCWAVLAICSGPLPYCTTGASSNGTLPQPTWV